MPLTANSCEIASFWAKPKPNIRGDLRVPLGITQTAYQIQDASEVFPFVKGE